MIEVLLYKVLPGVGWLVFYISIGILLGWLLELAGITQFLARLVGPVIHRANLPPVCTSSFATAFVSPKAAGGMLSAAYANGELSRRSLILGAVANSFASALMHLRVAGPLLISTLGIAGLAYVSFTVMNSLIVLLTVLIIGSLKKEQFSAEAPDATDVVVGEYKSLPAAGWRVVFKRWRSLLPRVLAVAIPVYVLVAWLKHIDAFERLGEKMPAVVASILPPSAMSVVVMQMTSTTKAVPVAREFLNSGELTALALFFALVTGYVLSLPVRVLRRNLPSALSLYPGRNGLWITLLSQGIRFVVALGFVVFWVVLKAGR